MHSNENKTARKFKPTHGDMYSKRQIPAKAHEALEVIGKIVSRFEALVNVFDESAKEFDAAFLLKFTTESAIDAFKKHEKAFLPPVFRHLMVQVRKNWRDGGAVGIVQDLSNNTRLMRMLDRAWNGMKEEILPINSALPDDVILRIAKIVGFDEHAKLCRLWDIAEKGPLSEKNKTVVTNKIVSLGYVSVKLIDGGVQELLEAVPANDETKEPELEATVSVEPALVPKDAAAEINAKSGHEILREMMRKENAEPKPEPKQVMEIEVGGKVTAIKTVPKFLVISKVPTAISKGRTFVVTAITTRRGGEDILELDNGLARVPASFFEAGAVTVH